MGKTSKWFRNFLLGKKSEQSQTKTESNPLKEKKRWGFVRSSRSQQSPASTRETSSFCPDEIEQNKRAIAVAAASAAAAEAAIAAAQAAAEVVRLTTGCSRLSPVGFSGGSGGKKNEIWAAMKIQAAFRGYLARRALRALKGLVKLQALVRGRIVRKQAAETLRCMQALVRAQSRARYARAMLSQRSQNTTGSTTPQKAKSSAHGSGVNRDKAAHKRSLSRQSREEAIDMHGEDWLDQWMEERGRYSHQAPASSEEKIDKILEVDTQKPYFHVRRRKGHHRTLGSKSISDTIGRSYTSMPDSPSKKSSTVQCSVSSLSSIKIHSPKSEIADEEVNSISSRPSARGSRREFFTPTRSDCSASVYSDFPNYMSNTESSKAKVRSQSAPKQRPEYEKSASASRVFLHGFENSGSSRSRFAMKAYPGSGRLDRYGMPIREVDRGDRNRYY